MTVTVNEMIGVLYGKGRLINEWPTSPLRWYYPERGSTNYRVMKFVCDYAK